MADEKMYSYVISNHACRALQAGIRLDCCRLIKLHIVGFDTSLGSLVSQVGKISMLYNYRPMNNNDGSEGYSCST